MDDVIEWIERPDLVDAVALVAFRGWNDAGSAASAAAEFVRDQTLAKLVAIIDHDDFNDHQANRPHLVARPGGGRAIDWPDTRIYVAAARRRPIVVVIGEEPSLRWKEFCRVVTRALRGLGVSKVVTMGAFLGEVHHSHDVPVIGVVDEELRIELGLLQSEYEGPTGIIGVLTQWFAKVGLDSNSLWAASPHYLATTPNPKAARALVESFGAVAGMDLSTAHLSQEVEAWDEQVTEAIAENDDLVDYVRRLQETLDQPVADAGEELLGEIEEFLRDQ